MEVIKNTATNELNKRSRIFVPKDVFKAFGVDFLDYEHCRKWVLRRLHPKGAFCPACGVEIDECKLQRFWEAKRIKCKSCKKFFTALTGTFLCGSHMDFRELVLLAVFLATELRNNQIAEILGINSETVRLWRAKFWAIEKFLGDEYGD